MKHEKYTTRMRTWEVDDKVNYYWHYNKWGKLKYKSGQANCIGGAGGGTDVGGCCVDVCL